MAIPATLPSPCSAAQLSLRADDPDGDLSGMQKGGVYLFLTNTGKNACSISPLPHLALLDKRGKPVDLIFSPQGTRHMHPGPVVQPITLGPGKVVRTTLQWITGPVFPNGGGPSVTFSVLRLETAQGVVTTPLEGQVYGPNRHAFHIDYDVFSSIPK